MDGDFRTVAVVGRHDDATVAEPMAALVRHLTKSGVRILAAHDMSLDVPVERVDDDELGKQADLVIAIGGDGTMLYASGYARAANAPLLGINRGRLGFLADISPDNMLDSVDHIFRGDYSRESRLLLDARLHRAGGETLTAVAVNDVVLQRRDTGRMVDFETRIDGRYVNIHAGDGLIVATPTGSTAYSLSCGGPIIEPQLDAVVVVPICPHTLTDRPVVLDARQTIEVRLLERDDTNAEVAVDGRSIGKIEAGDRLEICASSSRLTLIHPPGYDYFGILRSKLFWGRDGRNRGSPLDASMTTSRD